MSLLCFCLPMPGDMHGGGVLEGGCPLPPVPPFCKILLSPSSPGRQHCLLADSVSWRRDSSFLPSLLPKMREEGKNNALP